MRTHVLLPAAATATASFGSFATMLLATTLTLSTLLPSLAMGSAISTPQVRAASDDQQQFYNITAISAANGKSTLECWQLTEPLSKSTDAGTAGTSAQKLGDTSNATYTVLPAKFDGGLHRAPAAQYVAFLSGLAHVTLPGSKDEAYIEGGQHGLIIAADTAAVSTEGHSTNYPSDKVTTALQIPFKDGKLPGHKVLHKGACKKCDLNL